MADPRVAMYRAAVLACAAAGGMLAAHDLAETLRAIETAETMGPIIDPTLFKDKAKAMREDAELLRAALPLWRLVSERLIARGTLEVTGG